MQRSLALSAAAVAALIALSLAPRQAALAQAVGSLTATDYIEIQQLVHKLSFALDYCTNGGRDFADLFVDGGQMAAKFGTWSDDRADFLTDHWRLKSQE